MQYTKLDHVALLNDLGIKNVFTQNSKMRKTAKTNNIHLFNFGIPAYISTTGLRTCPQAKSCVAGCYARTGTYRFSSSIRAYENRLKLTQSSSFVSAIKYELNKILANKKTGTIFIRVHDSGDFYSSDYQATWYAIAKQYVNEPRLQFYAYTKSIEQSKSLSDVKPDNFRLIYSLGGFQDASINQAVDRHAKVFESESSLDSNGYTNATNDDMLALAPNNKVGLVYHGVKNYLNTTWDKV